MVAVYLTSGEVMICSGITKDNATGLVSVNQPMGVTDTILPNTVCDRLIIRSSIIDRIYIGTKTEPQSNPKAKKEKKKAKKK